VRARGLRCGAAITLLSLCAASARAEADGELRFDPFRAREEPSAASPGAAGATAEAFVPELRATLISRQRSVVDLGGVILEVGDEAHGYTLLEVWPYEAVFEYGGAEVVLEVPQPLRASPPAARRAP
jgi:hypothetical protein